MSHLPKLQVPGLSGEKTQGSAVIHGQAMAAVSLSSFARQ